LVDRVTGGASALAGALRKNSRARKERAAAKAVTPRITADATPAVQ
jgi:hypothetical protein